MVASEMLQMSKILFRIRPIRTFAADSEVILSVAYNCWEFKKLYDITLN